MTKKFFIDKNNSLTKINNTILWLHNNKKVVTDDICGVFKQLIVDTGNISLISMAKDAILYFDEEERNNEPD